MLINTPESSHPTSQIHLKNTGTVNTEALVELMAKFEEEDKVTPCVEISRQNLANYIGTAKETLNRLVSGSETNT